MAIKEMESQLNRYKQAAETLKQQQETVEEAFIKAVEGQRLDFMENTMHNLRVLDRAEFKLKKLIHKTDQAIDREYMKHVKPENCLNYIDNGGDCTNTRPWYCKADCECFDCKLKAD